MSNIKLIHETKQEKDAKTHDNIMGYLDEVKKLMDENKDKAELMISIIGTGDGYYNAVFIQRHQIFEAVGMLEQFKTMLLNDNLPNEK